MAYTDDGRAPLLELHGRYDELCSKYGFVKRAIYTVNVETETTPCPVTVSGYQSAHQGPSLWILSGIHGEEPAGPNAIAENIDQLGQLGQDIPLVVMPLLNPKGYHWNWRYVDERRNWRAGHSVSDCEHYLPDPHDPSRPRAAQPSSEIAAKVSQFVLDTAVDYPPVLTIDHHEDEHLGQSYVYSQGEWAAEDEVALAVIRILAQSGLPPQMAGHTRFNERIKGGVVVDQNDQPVKDGSVDELLAAARIIVAGEVLAKTPARTSLVIETPSTDVPLARRIGAHSSILKQLRTLWSIANQ